MALRGLIIANKPRDDLPGLPRNLLVAGGLTVLERQLRLIRQHHVDSVILVVDQFGTEITAALAGMKRVPRSIEVVDERAARDILPKTDSQEPADDWVILEDGVLVDERLIAAVVSDTAQGVVATLEASSRSRSGLGQGTPISSNGDAHLFASVMRLPGTQLAHLLEAIATPLTEPAWFDEAFTALRTMETRWRDIASLDTYRINMRRDVAIMWRPVFNEESARRGERALLAAAQNGVLDWPARFIHPPLENLCVTYLAGTSVTPNLVTIATGILGIAVTFLFGVGLFWIAVAGALVIGVLDGVDGKLARVTLQTTKVGELEHVLDKIIEYSWFVAMAVYFAGLRGDVVPYLLAGGLILSQIADIVQTELYRRLAARQLDDAGPFERAFRLVGGRRNIYMFWLLPFGFFGVWESGFWFIAFYGVATFFIRQWRVALRLRRLVLSPDVSLRQNLKKTSYF